MATEGFFDPNLRKEAWYDIFNVREGWFDETLIPAAGGASPPSAPTLQATAGDGQVTLAWNAPAGALSYKLYRSIAPGVYGSPLASGILDTSYIDSDVVNGVTYYYVVKATNGAGDSSASNEVNATPTAAVVTTTPSGVAPRSQQPQVHGPPIKINHFEEELVIHQAVQLHAEFVVEVPFGATLVESMLSKVSGEVELEKTFSARLAQPLASGLAGELALESAFALAVDPRPRFALLAKIKALNLEQDNAIIRQMMTYAGEEVNF